MICPKCGNEITDEKFCPNCGSKIVNEGNSNINDLNDKNTCIIEKKWCYGLIAVQAIILLLGLIAPNVNTLWATGASIGMLIMDWILLKKNGIKGVWKVWGLFIIPVYLWLRARKTDKKYGLTIVSIIIMVIAVITYLLSSIITEYNRGKQSNIESLPTYLFAVEGYVEIQEGEIESINVADYLPDRTMTLTYEQLDENNAVIPGLRTIDYVEPYYNDENKVAYRTETPELTAEALFGGYLYYDDKEDCLVRDEILAKTLTGGNDTAYLIPMGKSLKTNENESIQNTTYLFTVTTDSGKYEDCVCVLDNYKNTDKEVLHATFYAKGIGDVLTTTNSLSDDKQDFQVSSMLVNVEDDLNIGNSNNEDIDYGWWENKCYVSERTKGKFYGFRYSEGGNPYFTFGNCCVSIDKAKTSIINDGEKAIEYIFQTQMLMNNGMTYDEYTVKYFMEKDTVVVSNGSGTYSDSFTYDSTYQLKKPSDDSMISESPNNQTDSENVEEACHLFEGQRFECFETVSGEDITLTVRLYYSDDSDTPSSYKGELSNGVEFWFEPYESSSDCMLYKIDCMDGTTAYLRYSPDTSEIVFSADEGTEYGNMYAYSGTYIGLPDEGTDEEN